MTSHRKSFSLADTLLLFMGLAGLAVYLFLLPNVHPDAAPEFALNQEEILDRAKGFAYNRGYTFSGYEWEVIPVRSTRILDTLQSKIVDQSLYEILKNPDFSNLPAYGWEAIAINRSSTDDEEDRISISLTQAGDVWDFEAKTTQQVAPVREALLLAQGRQTPSGAVPDSVSTDRLVAQFWAINPPPGAPPRFDSLRSNRFDREDARAIARYYLNVSLLQHYNLSADSVTRQEVFNPNVVRVNYTGKEAASGMAVKAHIDITNAGVLQAISTTYAPELEIEETSNNGIEFDLESDDKSALLSLFAYILLGLFTFILFLRRLNARLIDVKGALQDAIWGGLFASLFIGNYIGWQFYQESASALPGLLAAMGAMLAAGSIGAFGVFIISCATDSIARAVWPNRLSTLTLARNFRFFNIPMGLSLIRSVGMAGFFLGLATLFLTFPGIVFSTEEKYLAGHSTLSPIIDLITSSGLYAMFICMMVLLSLGATLYSQRPSRWLVIAAVTLLAALLQVGPLDIYPSIPQWLLSGTVGLVLISSLFRFDYFSCFGGFALFTLFWNIAPLWLMPVADAQLDLLIAFVLLPVLLVSGFVGLIIGKEVDDVDQFLPTYLREMAQQERMRGELEIARQVQSSLLPRHMPSMTGIDIAAMCLPAQEVGGDYFDFIQLDQHRLALIIGDVSGKGIQAGFFMTLTKGFIHAVCETVDSPAEVLTKVNRLFCKNVPRGTFISLIYGIIDVANNTFTFARAGHDPVLYRTSEEDNPIFYKPKGMAIGLTPKDTFEDAIQDEIIDLQADDLLVFYTDGITEAINPKMEQFGVKRLAEKVEGAGFKKSARQVLQEVSEHIQAFVQTAGRVDDMTMVIVRIAPSQDVLSFSNLSSESQPWLEHEV